MFSVSFRETSPKASLSHGILTPVFRFRFYFIRRCTHFSTYELAVSSDFRVQFKYLKDNYRFYSLRYIRFGMILPQSNLWKFWRNRKFEPPFYACIRPVWLLWTMDKWESFQDTLFEYYLLFTCSRLLPLPLLHNFYIDCAGIMSLFFWLSILFASLRWTYIVFQAKTI